MLRERPRPRMEGWVGAAFCIYWGEVSDDSDGPLEWCRAVPDADADAITASVRELTLRTEAAHSEAVVHLGLGGHFAPAQWQLASESLTAWAAERGVRPTDLGVRVTFLASGPPGPDSQPDRDFAVPFVSS